MTTESQTIPDTAVEARLAIQQSVELLYRLVEEFHLDADGDLLRSLQALKERAESNEIVLAVLGEFASGKSTFINSLLRTDLRTGILPITAVCTYISYSSTPQCEVTLKDGRSILVDPQTVSEYSSEGPRSAEVARIELRNPASLLADGLIVVDTPGVDVNIDSHELMTASAIEESNACVYIIDCRVPGSETTIDYLRRVQNKIGKFFFVLNRADIWDEEQREEGLQFVEKVLIEECGIADPRVVLLSSTLARSAGNDHWNRCFEEFEHSLNSFMRNERWLIIANEVAHLAAAVSARADYLLNSKWSLTEQELARHYKTRLPDSRELIERLRAETISPVGHGFQMVQTRFRAYHQELTSGLRSQIVLTIESAASKKELEALRAFAEKVFGKLFVSISQRLREYLMQDIQRTYEDAHSKVISEVSSLLSGVAQLEDRAFFSRPSSYFSALTGGLAGIVISVARLSIAEPHDALFSFPHSSSISVLLLFFSSGILGGFMVARILWSRRVRISTLKGEVFSFSAFEYEPSQGFWDEVFITVFPGKIKKRLMERFLKACDSFSANTGSEGSVWIERQYNRVRDDILNIVDDTVKRYDGIIARAVKAQKSVESAIERRLTELKSASKTCKGIQEELACASAVIRTSLGGYEGSMPTHRSFVADIGADVVAPPISYEEQAGHLDQAGKGEQGKFANVGLWWSAGVAAIVMFVLAFMMSQPVASPEHAVATQALQPSPAQPVEAPKDLPMSDDYSVIRNALASEGYLGDGPIMDVPEVAPGAMLHVQKVSCTGTAEPCRKLFVFVGAESVWSEDLANYTSFSLFSIGEPGKFSAHFTQQGPDGTVSASTAEYIWDGTNLSRSALVQLPSGASEEASSSLVQPTNATMASPATDNAIQSALDDMRRAERARKNQAQMPPNPEERSDGQIEMDVVHALAASTALKNDSITVATIQREVTLSGSVSDGASRELAERIVIHVQGVTKVRNDITISTSDRPTVKPGASNSQTAANADQRIDDQITAAVNRAISVSLYYPREKQIFVNTIQHEVTLSGTVPNEVAREMAESLAGRVRGVTAVHNDIRVRQMQSPGYTQSPLSGVN